MLRGVRLLVCIFLYRVVKTQYQLCNSLCNW